MTEASLILTLLLFHDGTTITRWKPYPGNCRSLRSMPVDHYENFPVASILLPKRLRPAVEAIYAFARSADDLADEGDAAPEERLAALTAYEDALARIKSKLRATGEREVKSLVVGELVMAELRLPTRTLGKYHQPFGDIQRHLRAVILAQ